MNQLTTTNQVKNLVAIRKSLARGRAGNLAENRAFLDFLTIQAQMTEEINKTWDVVKEQMEAHSIQKINGDWGHILIAERKNFSGAAAPRFMKKVLDTSKVAAYLKLHNKVPEGVVLTTTKYLSKRVKVA